MDKVKKIWKKIYKYYLKLKSYIVSVITRKQIEYVDGSDITPLCEVVLFEGAEEHM